jgi:hypothetical protein
MTVMVQVWLVYPTKTGGQGFTVSASFICILFLVTSRPYITAILALVYFTSWPNPKMHNEELHNLYSSPNIIRQMKSRRMRWARYVARMGEERKVYKVLVGCPKERDHSEDQDVSGRMGSEGILGRLAVGCGMDSTGSG